MDRAVFAGACRTALDGGVGGRHSNEVFSPTRLYLRAIFLRKSPTPQPLDAHRHGTHRRRVSADKRRTPSALYGYESSRLTNQHHDRLRKVKNAEGVG